VRAIIESDYFLNQVEMWTGKGEKIGKKKKSVEKKKVRKPGLNVDRKRREGREKEEVG
jgi:hypothetical protein